jgi:uncharacterized membrane protein YkoI
MFTKRQLLFGLALAVTINQMPTLAQAKEQDSGKGGGSDSSDNSGSGGGGNDKDRDDSDHDRDDNDSEKNGDGGGKEVDRDDSKTDEKDDNSGKGSGKDNGKSGTKRDKEHDRARKAVQNGKAAPLKDVIEHAERTYKGKVLNVELRERFLGYVYEVKLLAANNTVRFLRLDAKSLRKL